MYAWKATNTLTALFMNYTFLFSSVDLRTLCIGNTIFFIVSNFTFSFISHVTFNLKYALLNKRFGRDGDCQHTYQRQCDRALLK